MVRWETLAVGLAQPQSQVATVSWKQKVDSPPSPALLLLFFLKLLKEVGQPFSQAADDLKLDSGLAVAVGLSQPADEGLNLLSNGSEFARDGRRGPCFFRRRRPCRFGSFAARRRRPLVDSSVDGVGEAFESVDASLKPLAQSIEPTYQDCQRLRQVRGIPDDRAGVLGRGRRRRCLAFHVDGGADAVKGLDGAFEILRERCDTFRESRRVSPGIRGLLDQTPGA